MLFRSVDTNQLSVLLEATGIGGYNGDTVQGAYVATNTQIASNVQTRVQALTANLSTALGTGNVWANVITVSSSGFKLA